MNGPETREPIAPPRALVIDDCRITELLVRHVLEEAGMPTDVAGTAEEGLERFDPERHVFVLADIVLPDGDGCDVAAELRRRSEGRALGLFLLTGLGEQFRDEMVESSGADGVFFKPITPSRLVDAARAAGDRARRSAEKLPSQAHEHEDDGDGTGPAAILAFDPRRV